MSSEGFFTAQSHGVTVQPDGKTVLAGMVDSPLGGDAAVFRMNIDGSPDTTFNDDGAVTLHIDNQNARF